MKKVLLGLILLCSTSAWGDNTLAIDDFTIAAGEEKVIDVKMFNDVTFTAFQFELELPEGISVKFDEDEEEYCVARSSRLLNAHNVVSQYQSNGAFKVMVYHNTNKNLKGNSGDVVLTLTLVASDQVSTGTFTPHINNIEMTEYNSTTQTATKYKPEAVTYSCTVNVNATVTTLGYASFSWPRALDFTNSGVTAFIAKDCDWQSIQLEEVTKVPANTGLILKGTAGSDNTYSLQTTDDEALDDVSSNQLTGTADGVYTVAGDNIYVLSNLDDGQAGFYLASEGIHVGQYKAYLAYTGTTPARQGLTFNESGTSTAIEGIGEVKAESNELFDLQGRRVRAVANAQFSTLSSQLRNGIYVCGGKKIIVK
jgi:hypothetical protein